MSRLLPSVCFLLLLAAGLPLMVAADTCTDLSRYDETCPFLTGCSYSVTTGYCATLTCAGMSEATCTNNAELGFCKWTGASCTEADEVCRLYDSSRDDCIASTGCKYSSTDGKCLGGKCSNVPIGQCTSPDNVGFCIDGADPLNDPCQNAPPPPPPDTCTPVARYDASTCAATVYSDSTCVYLPSTGRCVIPWSPSCAANDFTTCTNAAAAQCSWSETDGCVVIGTEDESFCAAQNSSVLDCTGDANECHYSSADGVCLPGRCGTLSLSACVSTDYVGFCEVSNGLCINARVGVAAFTNSTACKAAGGYFDIWENAVSDGRQVCFDNVGQVMLAHENIAARTCSYWQLANVGDTWAAACDAHGCTSFGTDCLNTYNSATPAGLPGAIAVSNIAQWDSMQQVANSRAFTFRTLIPFELATTPNTWWAAVVGSDGSANVATSVVSQYSTCTSFAALDDSTGTSRPKFPSNFVVPAGLTQDQLNYNIRDFIERFHHVDFEQWPTGTQPTATYTGFIGTSFDLNLAYKPLMQASFGNFKVGSGSPISKISVSDNGNTLELDWLIDSDAVLACPGVLQQTTDGSETRVIPTSIAVLTSEGGIALVTNRFYETISTSGAITITPNSRYRSHVFLDESFLEQGECDTGSGRFVFRWIGEYFGVMDTRLVVGPRAIGDIHDTSIANEQYLLDNPGFNPLFNQYFETSTAFTASSCDYASGICRFSVTRTTECRVLTPDGQAFNTSASANAANYASVDAFPVLEGGAHNTDTTKDAAYEALLNQHGFYIDVYSCFEGDCTRINSMPSGEYDALSALVRVNAFPGTAISSRLEITGGLLDLAPLVRSSVQTDLVAGFRAMVKLPAKIGGVDQPPTAPLVDDNMRSIAIPYNREITPVIRLSDENLADVDVRFGIGASDTFRFTPMQMITSSTNPLYIPFPGTTPMNYLDLKPYMTHVPKNAKLACPTCLTLPVFGSNKGVDGFSIPVQNLNGPGGVWPGKEFQALQMEFRWYTGAGAGQTAGGAARRRMLSVSNDYYKVTVISGANYTSVVYLVNIQLNGTDFQQTPPLADVEGVSAENVLTSGGVTLLANALVGLSAYTLVK
jgi:hypothetical protein